MKKIIFIFVMNINMLNADYYGVIEAIVLAGVTGGAVAATMENIDNLSKEMKKSVEISRKILKAEIVRNTLINKKIYWIDKIRKNISRGIDVDSISVQISINNNKIWIYNNSLLYSIYKIKGAK